MRKAYLLGIAIGGSMLLAASGAFAATAAVTVAAKPGNVTAPLAKLADAAGEPAQTGTGDGAAATGTEVPDPAKPTPRKRRGFFGLPVLAGLGIAGAGGAALTNGDGPGSP